MNLDDPEILEDLKTLESAKRYLRAGEEFLRQGNFGTGLAFLELFREHRAELKDPIFRLYIDKRYIMACRDCGLGVYTRN